MRLRDTAAAAEAVSFVYRFERNGFPTCRRRVSLLPPSLSGAFELARNVTDGTQDMKMSAGKPCPHPFANDRWTSPMSVFDLAARSCSKRVERYRRRSPNIVSAHLPRRPMSELRPRDSRPLDAAGRRIRAEHSHRCEQIVVVGAAAAAEQLPRQTPDCPPDRYPIQYHRSYIDRARALVPARAPDNNHH